MSRSWDVVGLSSISLLSNFHPDIQKIQPGIVVLVFWHEESTSDGLTVIMSPSACRERGLSTRRTHIFSFGEYDSRRRKREDGKGDGLIPRGQGLVTRKGRDLEREKKKRKIVCRKSAAKKGSCVDNMKRKVHHVPKYSMGKSIGHLATYVSHEMVRYLERLRSVRLPVGSVKSGCTSFILPRRAFYYLY